MILILSESNDVSTDFVTEWLQHLQVPFKRLHQDDLRNALDRIVWKDGRLEVYLRIGETVMAISDISRTWFRRAYIDHQSGFHKVSHKGNALQRQMNTLLSREEKDLTRFVAGQLAANGALSNQLYYQVNKLEVLVAAQAIGFKIPDTIITRDMQDIANCIDADPEQVITKSICDMYPLQWDGTAQIQPTTLISDLPSQPQRFYYSLFQQKVDKKYELRIFFLEQQFFAAAIFSRGTDGRDIYADNEQVRIVPFRLPDMVREKLASLCDRIGLASGSIDMIIDKQDQYYFIEVNPAGQYGYISLACNYHLDRKIAEYLAYGKLAV